MNRSARVLTSALAAAILLSAYSFAQDDKEEKKSKHTIKEVMNKANKGGDSLVKKVIAGDADEKEKLALLDMYISLVENKPPKGDESSWQRLAGSAALAAAKVAVGREGAEAELKTATNCAACHKLHKASE